MHPDSRLALLLAVLSCADPRPALAPEPARQPIEEAPAGGCPGHRLAFGGLVDTHGTSPPYVEVTTPLRAGQICALSCLEPWITAWVAVDTSCGAALPLPVTVTRAGGGAALCFALSGEPPSTPWSATCTVEHSPDSTTVLPVAW